MNPGTCQGLDFLEINGDCSVSCESTPLPYVPDDTIGTVDTDNCLSSQTPDTVPPSLNQTINLGCKPGMRCWSIGGLLWT